MRGWCWPTWRTSQASCWTLLQYAYQVNMGLHSILQHFDTPGIWARIPLEDSTSSGELLSKHRARLHLLLTNFNPAPRQSALVTPRDVCTPHCTSGVLSFKLRLQTTQRSLASSRMVCTQTGGQAAGNNLELNTQQCCENLQISGIHNLPGPEHNHEKGPAVGVLTAVAQVWVQPVCCMSPLASLSLLAHP